MLGVRKDLHVVAQGGEAVEGGHLDCPGEEVVLITMETMISGNCFYQGRSGLGEDLQ